MNTRRLLFASAAFIMLAISVIAAQAYSVDLTTYPLMIKDLKLTGENQIRFSLHNPAGSSVFDMKSLKSFEVTFAKTKTVQSFVHHSGDPLTAIGEIKDGESRSFIVPFDRYGQTGTELRCRQPIEIKIFLTNGQRIAHWTGIPDCEIIGKRPCGLIRIDDTVAEFEDESAGLKILWEFIDYDKDSGKVFLMKSVGRNDPVMQWVRVGDCMDIESGKCMTDIIDITFADDFVSVTLQDNRKLKLATLTRSFTQEPVSTYTAQPAQPTQSYQPTQSNQVAYQAAQQIGLIDADAQSQASGDVVCVSDCLLHGRCYDQGARNIFLDNYAYCSGNGWMIQKSNGFACAEDYECRSGKCTENKCGNNVAELDAPAGPKQNFMTRFLSWIDNWF